MPSLYARIDLNYRTNIFGGLTPTATLSHTGARAVSAGPQASLGGKQLMVPGYNTLDLVLARRLVHPESVNRTGGTLQDHGVHCQITYNFF